MMLLMFMPIMALAEMLLLLLLIFNDDKDAETAAVDVVHLERTAAVAARRLMDNVKIDAIFVYVCMCVCVCVQL